ncbi:MAG: MXAN_5187 C-terminal domain-containing protein [Bradymonadia bacterium]
MTPTRLLAFVALVFFGALAAGALTLTNVRDDDLRIAQWRTVQTTARVLELEATNALQAQTHVTRLLAADPRLLTALGQLDPKMPLALAPGLFDPVMEQLQAEHRTVDLALFDANRRPLGARPAALAERLAPRIADLEKSPLGLPVELNGRDRWVLVVPVASLTPKTPPGFLVTVGPLPVEVVLRAHQDSGQTLVRLAVALMGRPIGPGTPAPWVQMALDAAPKSPVVVSTGPSVRAARFEVPALPGLSLLLSWDEADPVGIEVAGGLQGVLSRALSPRPEARLALGGAVLVAVVVVLFGFLGTRRAVRALAAAVDELPSGTPLLPSRFAGWLRPLALSAVEAVSAGRKRGRGESTRTSGEHPAVREAAREAALAGPTEPVPRAAPVDDDTAQGEGPTEPTTEPKAGAVRPTPAVPGLDNDDADHETQTDADFRPAQGGSRLGHVRAGAEQRPGKPPPLPVRHENTAIRPVPMELLAALRDEQGRGEGSHVGPAPTELTAEDEAYLKEVFREFVALKRQCGEPTEQTEYRKFRQKLLRTRQQLVEKFKCRDVRFRVYVRDGKAALRAAPVLEEDAPV